MQPNIYSVHTPTVETTNVAVLHQGSGKPYLLLHGGGGPLTVSLFAGILANTNDASVYAVIHPGFGMTIRPDSLTNVRSLAEIYIQLLEDLELEDVIVIGNSIGGWIAAEMACITSKRISGFIIADGVGVEVEGHPVKDFFSLSLEQVFGYSYYNPSKFMIDISKLSLDAKVAMGNNRQALAVYTNKTSSDPTLMSRVSQVRTPVHFVWGDSDQIADSFYGKTYAGQVPGATFKILEKTGHLPQLESPELFLKQVVSFREMLKSLR